MEEIFDILKGDKAIKTENEIVFDPATTFLFFMLLLLVIGLSIFIYKKV